MTKPKIKRIRTSAKSPLTIEAIKQAIGTTWFDFDLSEDGETITFETRRHGDVCEETHGAQDLAEARRIRAHLPPMTHHKRSLECVDEWVVCTISVRPFAPADIKNNVRREKGLKLIEDRRGQLNKIPTSPNCSIAARLRSDLEAGNWILEVEYGTTVNSRHIQYQFADAIGAEAFAVKVATDWGSYSVTCVPMKDICDWHGVPTHVGLGVVRLTGRLWA